jgi:hypothetical protein
MKNSGISMPRAFFFILPRQQTIFDFLPSLRASGFFGFAFKGHSHGIFECDRRAAADQDFDVVRLSVWQPNPLGASPPYSPIRVDSRSFAAKKVLPDSSTLISANQRRIRFALDTHFPALYV